MSESIRSRLRADVRDLYAFGLEIKDIASAFGKATRTLHHWRIQDGRAGLDWDKLRSACESVDLSRLVAILKNQRTRLTRAKKRDRSYKVERLYGQVRRDARDLFASGLSVKGIGDALGRPSRTVYYWRAQDLKAGLPWHELRPARKAVDPARLVGILEGQRARLVESLLEDRSPGAVDALHKLQKIIEAIRGELAERSSPATLTEEFMSHLHRAAAGQELEVLCRFAAQISGVLNSTIEESLRREKK